MKRKVFLYRAVLIGAIILAIGVFVFLQKQKEKAGAEQVKRGVEKLEELEQKNVAEIEETIAQLEKDESKPDSVDTLKKKMKNAVVLRDSITNSLIEYHVINEENVIAKIGISLTQTKELLDKAVSLNKKKVFLAFGMNDLEATYGDEKLFREQYKEVIDYLQKHIPDVEIYVNSILPMQEIAFEKVKENAKYPEFNAELKKLCEEENIVFMDNTDLVKEEYFEPDGIHMVYDFYIDWVNRMISVGGL